MSTKTILCMKILPLENENETGVMDFEHCYKLRAMLLFLITLSLELDCCIFFKLRKLLRKGSMALFALTHF